MIEELSFALLSVLYINKTRGTTKIIDDGKCLSSMGYLVRCTTIFVGTGQ